MRHTDGRLFFSATDLSRHLSCSHLTSLRRAVALGEIERPPPYDDPRADVLKQRGIEHERHLLEQFAADGRSVATITAADAPFSHQDRANAAARTTEAMRRGVDVIYQGRLEDADGRWSGYPDFLLRVDTPSALGGWSYEVLDAKLARSAKGEALLQLLLYSDLLARVQGMEPAWMHLALGGGDGPAGALPCCGVRGVLSRGPPPLSSARRCAPGDLPGAGRSLRALRVEAVLRGAAPGRRSPVARRRHHTRSAAPTGRARRPDDGGSGVARSAGRPANRGRGRRRAGPDPRAGAGAGSRAAGTPAHPRADHAGRAGQGTRRAAGTVGRRCLLRSRRGRLRDGRRPRVPVRRRGPRRRVRSALGARSADREARVRELHRPGHGALATASRLPHLPLRRLRDDRRQAPDEPLRHPRGRGGPAAARRRVRRPAPRGATGAPGLCRALFDQEAGAVLRFHPPGRACGRDAGAHPVRSGAGVGRRQRRGRRAPCRGRGLQPRRLPVDATARRMAGGMPGRTRGLDRTADAAAGAPGRRT